MNIVACAQEIIGGISNGGYWGMSVQAGRHYFFSAFAADPSLAGAAGKSNIGVRPMFPETALLCPGSLHGDSRITLQAPAGCYSTQMLGQSDVWARVHHRHA